MTYKYLLPFVLIFTSLSSSAEKRWFEVELLLFQRNVNIKDIKEVLATENIAIDSSKSIELIKTRNNFECIENKPCLHKKNPPLIEAYQFASLENDFIRLDNKLLQLSALHEKLENHRSFKPLLHLAWRMPMESGRTAKPIHLFAGKNFAFDMQKEIDEKLANLKLEEDKSTEEQTLLIENEIIENASESQLVEKLVNSGSSLNLLTDKWAIDGNFKIYLDHYLFIDSQLIIRQQVTEEIIQPQPKEKFEIVNSENDVEVIRQTENETAVEVLQKTVIKEVLFDQNRRLRSGEIHYLDHPLMGIIVQIRKIPEDELTEIEEE